jgi:asparagine synthase (glutamine-hydrolysing)
MCGVLAIWNRDGAPVDLAALQRGSAAMRHRGPDDEGYVLIDTQTGRAVACRGRETRADVSLPALDSVRGPFDLALGHRRLAIIDRSRDGHQPMSTEDGALWVAFNGMIYNFAEVRSRLEALGHTFRSRTDTEVVLRAYREWGSACVEHLSGMWAFVVWDAPARQLFASRDRLGIKPLVYHVGESRVAFGSELKGLTAFAVPREIDAEALHHYLSLMNVPAPFTIYRGIRKLAPGHSLVVRPRSVTDRVYWRLEPAPRASSGTDAVEELDELIQDSVRRHLAGDVPAGTLLSGGVDSSIVTAVAATMTRPAELPTYNLTVPDAAHYDESAWARRVSTHLGTDHHAIPAAADVLSTLPELVSLFDEPFAVSSVIGVHRLAREASNRVKILLTGDGGDEVFAGYLTRYARVDELWERISDSRGNRLGVSRAQAAGDWVRWEPFDLLARVKLTARTLPLSDDAGRDVCFNLRKVTLNDAEKRALYTPEWRDRTRGMSTVSWLGSRLRPAGTERLARWQLQDIHTSLHDEMLAKVDKATMACGVEARVPLLDHRIVEFATSLPARLKIADGHGKWILKKVGERYVPHDVLYREKAGFSMPLSEWFRGAWRPFVRDTLSPSALGRVGVLDGRAVDGLIAYHESHPGFRTAHMLFTLLGFQMWHDVCHQRSGG